MAKVGKSKRQSVIQRLQMIRGRVGTCILRKTDAHRFRASFDAARNGSYGLCPFRRIGGGPCAYCGLGVSWRAVRREGRASSSHFKSDRDHSSFRYDIFRSFPRVFSSAPSRICWNPPRIGSVVRKPIDLVSATDSEDYSGGGNSPQNLSEDASVEERSSSSATCLANSFSPTGGAASPCFGLRRSRGARRLSKHAMGGPRFWNARMDRASHTRPVVSVATHRKGSIICHRHVTAGAGNPAK